MTRLHRRLAPGLREDQEEQAQSELLRLQGPMLYVYLVSTGLGPQSCNVAENTGLSVTLQSLKTLRHVQVLSKDAVESRMWKPH